MLGVNVLIYLLGWSHELSPHLRLHLPVQGSGRRGGQPGNPGRDVHLPDPAPAEAGPHEEACPDGAETERPRSVRHAPGFEELD